MAACLEFGLFLCQMTNLRCRVIYGVALVCSCEQLHFAGGSRLRSTETKKIVQSHLGLGFRQKHADSTSGWGLGFRAGTENKGGVFLFLRAILPSPRLQARAAFFEGPSSRTIA